MSLKFKTALVFLAVFVGGTIVNCAFGIGVVGYLLGLPSLSPVFTMIFGFGVGIASYETASNFYYRRLYGA